MGTNLDAWLGGKRVTVVGAGRSGLAAIAALSRRGARAFLSEARRVDAPLKATLDAQGVAYEQGGHTKRLRESELVVLSPGVRWTHPQLVQARAEGLPVWSELELGFRLSSSAHIVAITGTNGKSTTTRLLGQLLRSRGHPTVIGGNLGTPLCALLDDITPQTWVVLEVSSFQLEGVCQFKPHIGAWLNLAPDHLDRHGSLERYRGLKARLFTRQTDQDHALVAPDLAPILTDARVRRVAPLPPTGRFAACPVHLRQDLAFALCAARLVDPRCAWDAVPWERWLGHPHCLEYVATAGGVSFYNDSKATNPHATRAALEALKTQGPLCVILGGCAKGTPPDALANYIARHSHVRQALVLGTGERWQRALGRAGFTNVRSVTSFSRALGRLDDAVTTCVLSPAGSSFDLFDNYEARGEAFKAAVNALS